MSQSVIDLPLVLGEQNGHPTIVAVNPSVTLNNFKIKDHGGASWLYNLLLGLFKGAIRKQAQQGIEHAVVTTVNQLLAHALSSLNLKIPIDKFGTLDLSLASSPVETDSVISFAGKGQFEAVGYPPAPLTPTTVLPDSLSSTTMLQLFFSEYASNTALYMADKAGLLDTSFGNQNLPASSPFTLNTSYFRCTCPLPPFVFSCDCSPRLS